MENGFDPKTYVITIGRSFGSGGGKFAEALGRRLSLPVFNEKLLTRAAQESNIREDLLRRMDECNDFSMPLVFNTQGLSTPGSFFLYNDNYLSGENLFNVVAETITELAKKGSLILVGRCSDFILRDHPNLLSVFVTEKKELRLQRIMERVPGVKSPAEAEEYMVKADKQRRQYYNFYTGRRWGRCENYDVSFKLSELGTEYAIDFLVSLLERKNFPLGSSPCSDPGSADGK